MDVLTLTLVQHSWADEPPAPAVVISINDRPLSQVILEAEENVADGRTWSSDVHPAALWRSLLEPWADLPTDPDRGRWTPVLVCGCGDFPCGGFAARISCSPGTVVWHDFVDAYSYALALWDDETEYSRQRRLASASIGPFRFDEHAYSEEVARALSQC